nr:molybdenum cofactor guanylyltransferase MobA [uncultured Cohaesibacter sp.]
MSTKDHSAVAVILAGGQSRRMKGANKALLPLAGVPLIQHAVDRLTDQVDKILISAPGPSSEFPAGYPVIADPIEGFVGPLAGILGAMRWSQAEGSEDYVLSVAVDTPFFPHDLLARFLARLPEEKNCPVIARSEKGLHPTFGLWPVSLSDELEAFLLNGNRKMRSWAEQQQCVYCDFAPMQLGPQTLDPFFNINHSDDLHLAEKMCSALH